MSEPHQDKEQAGWVYAMFNPSIPGSVKIGETGRTPEERRKELSASTSVPSPFVILCAVHVSDCYKIEQELHTFYADRRYGKEFFTISHEEVVNKFSTIEGEQWISAPKLNPPKTIQLSKHSTYADFKVFHDQNIALEKNSVGQYNRQLEIIRRICMVLGIPNTTTLKTWSQDEWATLVPLFNAKQSWPEIGHYQSSLIEIAKMEFHFKSARDDDKKGCVGPEAALASDLGTVLRRWSGTTIVNIDKGKTVHKPRVGPPLPPWNAWQKTDSAERLAIKTANPTWNDTEVLAELKRQYHAAKSLESKVLNIWHKTYALEPFEGATFADPPHASTPVRETLPEWRAFPENAGLRAAIKAAHPDWVALGRGCTPLVNKEEGRLFKAWFDAKYGIERDARGKPKSAPSVAAKTYALKPFEGAYVAEPHID